MTKYRGYTIKPVDHPTIPGAWYVYTHRDHDGPEDARCGSAKSVDHAKGCIDMLEDE
ncbi:MAG: hypothetical protein V3R25_10250 [Nitrosomonadaceae bacterium]